MARSEAQKLRKKETDRENNQRTQRKIADRERKRKARALKKLKINDTADKHSVHEDYYSAVLGHSPDPKKLIRWSGSNILTALPWIEDEDYSRVVSLARGPDAPADEFVVIIHDLKTIQNEVGGLERLQKICEEALAHDKFVFMPKACPDNKLNFDFNDLIYKLGVNDRVYQKHSMRKRLEDWSNPHVDTTLSDFFTNNSAVEPEFILDMPWDNNTSHPIVYNLDNGSRFGWEHTNLPYKAIPHDVTSSRGWALAHRPLTLTYAHVDGGSPNTNAENKCGLKIWTAIRPRGISTLKSRDQIFSQWEKYFVMTEALYEYEKPSANVDFYRFFLEQGDMLLMPAGMFHEVYTPIESIACGGHFYNFNTMHLTEIGRAFAHKQARQITNALHPAVNLTIFRMLCAIPRLNSHHRFFRKPLSAHISMVLKPQLYTPENGKRKTDKDPKSVAVPQDIRAIATRIAQALIKHFNLKTDPQEFLFEDTVRWSDPGKELVGVVDVAKSALPNLSAEGMPI